jgi:hypothetical protein
MTTSIYLHPAPAFYPYTGTISFSSISFSYLPERKVFDDFSLNIRASEKVALVGPSGAGKSTLMALLLGLWQPQQGSIQIDGQDITRIDRESLLASIAVISQETSLFDRTMPRFHRHWDAALHLQPDLEFSSLGACGRASGTRRPGCRTACSSAYRTVSTVKPWLAIVGIILLVL